MTRPDFVQAWIDTLVAASTSPRCTSEARAIYNEGFSALVEEREIDEATARAFASWYHDGSTIALSFVSTGTWVGSSDELMRALFPNGERDATSIADRAMYNLLGTYLLNLPGR